MRDNQILNVLEIGIGQGGDLFKWNDAKIANLVGIDPSDESLKEAQRRAEKIEGRSFNLHLIQQSGAIEKQKFYEKIDPKLYFDIVSLQFCIHYMFDSEESLLNLLDNIKERTLVGSYVIITLPDAYVIVKKLREKGVKKDDGYIYYENPLFSVRAKTLEFPKGRGYYGLEYGFHLARAVGYKNIYVPEFLVELNNLLKLTEERGFIKIEDSNFLDFYTSNKKAYGEYIENRRRKHKSPPELTEEETDISHCYRVLVLQRKLANIWKAQHMIQRNIKVGPTKLELKDTI